MTHPTVDADQILRHTPWVRALARRLLRGDVHRADDVVQEAWIAALDAKPAPQALRPWLATTVRNLSHHVRRSETRRAARERKVARAESQESGADLVARTELHRELLRHLLALDEPHRTTLLLRYVEHLPPRAIARRCDITPVAARTRLRRAHVALRGRLEREWSHEESTNWRAGLATLIGASHAPTWIGVLMAGKQSLAIGGALLVLAAAFLFWSTRDDDATRAERRTSRTEATNPGGSGTTNAETETTSTDSSENAKVETNADSTPEQNEIAPADSTFRVTGQVTWADGSARAVRVIVYQSRVGDHKLGSVETDSKGAFTTPLPESGRFLVEAVDRGTVVRKRFQIAEAGTASVELEFATGAVISGQVHNTFGALDDDVHGTFRPAGQEELEVHVLAQGDKEQPLPFSRVDDQGRYRIAGLAAGRYWLVVPSKFHIEEVSVDENGAVEHNIRLATGRVEGLVLDAETEKPVGPYVQVVIGLLASEDNREKVFAEAGMHRISARCAPDENGRYVFSNLPAGEYTMFANGGAYGLHRGGATLRKPELAATVDFTMEKGSVLDTTVTDPNGKPLQPMMIWSQGIRWGFQGAASGLKTGTFDVTVWGARHAIETRKDVVFKPGETTKVKFALAPAAETTLQFRDDRGRPVAGVRVSVIHAGQDVQRLLSMVYPAEPLRVSDANGHVKVRGVPAGACRLLAKKSGFAAVDEAIRLSLDKPERVVELKTADTKFEWRLRITRVAAGSAAAQAGLQPGDLLLTYDGSELATLRDLRAALARVKAGNATDVALTYERAGQSHETRATTGALGIGVEEIEVR